MRPMGRLNRAALLGLVSLLAACPKGGVREEEVPPRPADAPVASAAAKRPCDRFLHAPIAAPDGAKIYPCIHDIPNRDVWNMTGRGGDDPQPRIATYIVPARPDARLPTTFVPFGVAERHYIALRDYLPELFPGLTSAEWDAITSDSTRREFFSGVLAEFTPPGRPRQFFFAIFEWPRRTPPYDSPITPEDARHVQRELLKAMPLMTKLSIVPWYEKQRLAMATWKDPELHVALDVVPKDPQQEGYEPYSKGRSYGYLRFYKLADLKRAEEAGEFSYQDILVLDQAPTDIETVVSGIITATPQSLLTHLNVRSAARGTPNCYERGAFEKYRILEGKIIQFDCAAGYTALIPQTLKDAQVWWDSFRPPAAVIPAATVTKAPMPTLLELPTTTREERARATSIYGAKGTNLAILYRLVPADLQFQGFLIPAFYYDQFLRQGRWTPPGATAPMSFHDTIALWTKDPAFVNDTAERVKRLGSLRKAMRAHPIDPVALAEIRARIKSTFGREDAMVRLRSSSNAEDALGFAGAGIYDSYSGCAVDPDSPPAVAPRAKRTAKQLAARPRSACDKASRARPLERALAGVWASVWNTRAFDEREWSRIDHAKVAMGVLVSTRSDAERGNLVAFSGNPTTNDGRYVVTAQRGDRPAVSTAPGLVPETSLLTVEGGKVTTIARVVKSNVAPRDKPVISEQHLRRVGEVLASLRDTFPIDGREAAGSAEILLDTEWKVLGDGRLVIKQIRPFLRKPMF